MEMMLVNPRRRRKGRAKSRRRSSKRRRRMSAKQAAFFGGGRRKRRSNPIRSSRRRKRRGSRARRRNPSGRRFGLPSVGGISSQLMGALPGAVGALGLDILLGFVPIPASWKAGPLGYVTKILGALALGMGAKMVVSQHTAAQMTNGALTVMFHGIMRDFVATNVPGVPLGVYLAPPSGMGYYGSGYNPSANLNAYMPDMDAGPGMDDMVSLDTDSFAMGQDFN